jgi:hypothetical protein
MIRRDLKKYLWAHVEQENPIIIFSKSKSHVRRLRKYLQCNKMSMNKNHYSLYRVSNAPSENLMKIEKSMWY